MLMYSSFIVSIKFHGAKDAQLLAPSSSMRRKNPSDFAYTNWSRQHPWARTNDLRPNISIFVLLPINQMAHLALAKGPEIYAHANEVINARICALVEQQRGQTADWVDDETGLDATMHGGVGEPGKWILPGETQDAEEQVDDLQDGDRPHRAVEVGGEEIPEDFRPEEAFEGGGDLVCCARTISLVLFPHDGRLVVEVCGDGRENWLTGCGSEDDQSSPVVFDELAHDRRGESSSLAKTPNPAEMS
ncbi:hypothetical protein MMC07_009675 [Pseudocyphellaria aurata]|nr:hypothetical protein [Pseudocyphellaria aurata]